MLTAEDIEQALSLGHELRHLEFKGPGRCDDKSFFVKVVKAALSLGNLRDGGHVVIGIDDKAQQAMLPGLDEAQLASWAYDDVSRRLAEYADPPLRFELAPVPLSSGVSVAVTQVFEFSDIPHFCAKDYPGVLRKGALYVRPRKASETSEVASSTEMRDVLDLAAQKALRAYVETAERAALRLVTGPPEPAPTSEERFEEQRDGGLGMNTDIERIRAKCHWDITIRPELFQSDRVSYEHLDDILNSAVVRLRGWPCRSLTTGNNHFEVRTGSDKTSCHAKPGASSRAASSRNCALSPPTGAGARRQLRCQRARSELLRSGRFSST